MASKVLHYRFYTPLLCIMLSMDAMSQSVETIMSSRPVTMGGSISFNDNLEFLPDSSSNYYCLSGSLSTKFFGVVDVPLSFSYTNNQFTKNMAMPFNRFSLSPSYKEYTVYIGFNSMTFSKYTMSGHDYFGGGAAYLPSEGISAEAFFGRLRKAVQPDSTTSDAGYARHGGGLKIGYKTDRYEVSTNVIKIKDKDNSVSFDGYESQYVYPKDNIAASVKADVKVTDKLSLGGEYAVSQIYESEGKYTYHAFDCSVLYAGSVGSIGASYDRLPPNYETLGGYYFNEDEEQVALNMTTTIASKITLGGNFGYRHDNIEHQQIATNKSFAYAADLHITPMERLALSASINNDQSYVNLRDNLEQLTQMSEFEDLDTNEYSRLNLSANFGANYSTKPSDVLANNFNASFSYNTTSDHQRYDTASANSKIYNLNLGTSTTFLAPKISVGTNIGLSKTDSYSQRYKMLTLAASLSKTFAKGLALSCAYTYAATQTDTISSAVTNLRASANYTLFKKHSLGLSFCYIHNPMSPSMQNRYTLSFNYGYGFTIIGDKKKEEEQE